MARRSSSGLKGRLSRTTAIRLGLPGPLRLQHHGLLPRPPWPQPHSEVGLTACFTDSGPWRPVGSCSVGPLAVSRPPGAHRRPCSPGRPSLHQLSVKASVRELTSGPPKACRRDSIKGRSGPGPLGQELGRRSWRTPRPPLRVTDGLMEPPPTSDSRPGPGAPLPLVCGACGSYPQWGCVLPGYLLRCSPSREHLHPQDELCTH